MANKSRGAIEESTIVFSSETEKTIVFDAQTKGKAFNSPPVVKLIAVGTPSKLLSAQRNLLYNTAGVFQPTYNVNNAGTLSTTATDATAHNAAFRMVVPGFKTTITGSSSHNTFSSIQNGDTVTVPIDGSLINSNSLIQVFFKAKFTNWDVNTDSAFVDHVTKTQITANNDTTPITSGQTVRSHSTTFMQKNGAWVQVADNSDSYSSRLLATQLYAANNSYATGWHWIRFDIRKHASGDLTTLGGLSFRAVNTAAGEIFGIRDIHVIIWGDTTGDFSTGDAYWFTPDENDYFSSPPPGVFDSEGSPNVGVTFTNITTTGMKVITSAPFTGEIRYLCSVQG